MQASAHDRPASRWAAGVIGIAGLAAYANCYRGVLVLDDQGTLADNPTIRHLGSSLFPPANGLPVSGRPIANLSFAINYWLCGSHLAGYHALNLLIHLGSALLVFGIVRRFSSVLFGGVVALLWVVHPLLTSAVTYLSQRPESLMGFWYLLTIYAFLRAMSEAADRPMLARPWGWVSVASCCCGMATKEVMVTAPLLVFAFDWTWFASSFRQIWDRRRAYYSALGASWLIVAGLAFQTGSRGGTAGFGTGLSWWAYAIAQVGAILHYIRLAFWPAPLLADYGRLIGIGPVQTGLGASVLLALLILTGVLVARRSPLGVCGLWFFLILAPSSSVIPIATELVAEHRMYLPLIAVITVVVAGAAKLGKARAGAVTSSRQIWMGGGLALGVVAALIIATYRRNQVYRNLETFWGDIVAKVPGNAGAHNNLGNLALGRQDWRAAETEYTRALVLAPEYADAHGNLGVVFNHTGRSLDAIGHFEAALRYQPSNAAWRRGLADARAEYGNGLAEAGRSEQAIAVYQLALALAPDMADVRNNLGGLLAQSGRLRDAETQFAEAVRLVPDFREAQNNLRRVRMLEGLGSGP